MTAEKKTGIISNNFRVATTYTPALTSPSETPDAGPLKSRQRNCMLQLSGISAGLALSIIPCTIPPILYTPPLPSRATSVSDQLHFDADPDPRNRFRDNGSGPWSRSGSDLKSNKFQFFLLITMFFFVIYELNIHVY